MVVKKKSKKSPLWLIEHFKDPYVKKAKENKIRSRSWFKLEEIDKSNKLFKPGMNVLDLGSSPGGWSQYAVNKIGDKGYILACDVLPMKKIAGVNFFQGNIFDKKILNSILNNVSKINFNLIMSDMAPNLTGFSSIDMPKVIRICKRAFQISSYLLTHNGIFLVKSFHGEGFDNFFIEVKNFFSKIKICKPKTSRARSREIFILATR